MTHFSIALHCVICILHKSSCPPSISLSLKLKRRSLCLHLWGAAAIGTLWETAANGALILFLWYFCNLIDTAYYLCNPLILVLAQSVCGTCCIIGRVVTKLEDEEPIACDMGPKGICCCFASNVLMGPPGYACVGFCLRQQVLEKFNVMEEGPCILNTICYPCSYFQMFVSMSEWKRENTASTGTQNLK